MSNLGQLDGFKRMDPFVDVVRVTELQSKFVETFLIGVVNFVQWNCIGRNKVSKLCQHHSVAEIFLQDSGRWQRHVEHSF